VLGVRVQDLGLKGLGFVARVHFVRHKRPVGLGHDGRDGAVVVQEDSQQLGFSNLGFRV